MILTRTLPRFVLLAVLPLCGALAPTGAASDTIGTSASPTDDPRVFTLSQRFHADDLRVGIGQRDRPGEMDWLVCGEDFTFEAATGRILLLHDIVFDRETQFLFVTGRPSERGTFLFHRKLDPSRVKVILDGNRIWPGRGFEVDAGEGVLRITDPRIARSGARYYIVTGASSLCNFSVTPDIVALLDGDTPPPVEPPAAAPDSPPEEEKAESVVPDRPAEPTGPFADEPEAHALYDAMVEAMQDAETLSWTARYRFGSERGNMNECTYRIWLQKPNQFRVETYRDPDQETAGVLVGDGDYLWIYWPSGKPRYQWEYQERYAAEYEQFKDSYYMKKRTPVGRHSIGHEVGRLGAGMAMTILDPSTFHGYTDSLQPYIDGVRGFGTGRVGDEECDKIEVSIMDRQRSWYLWLSRKDHLPRKLEEVVRVSYDILVYEDWSDVMVDQMIAAELFRWQAPDGWKQWDFPPIEDGLLPPGTEAPDFELTAVDGAKIRLSDYRGSVVWLNKWRCG